jgi:hypothetical protein
MQLSQTAAVDHQSSALPNAPGRTLKKASGREGRCRTGSGPPAIFFDNISLISTDRCLKLAAMNALRSADSRSPLRGGPQEMALEIEQGVHVPL